MREVAYAIFLGLLLLGGVAHADAAPAAAPAATESARAHFASGVKMYDATPPDYVGALQEFKEAYRAKPSPGIKRNIALCLKGLQRFPEAIDALEQMLVEGGDTLSAAVRDATKKAIAELNTLITTVRVRIVPHTATANAPTPAVTLLVDDVELPKEKFAQPIRLAAGEHVFKALANGYIEGQQKKTLVGGERDVEVEIELVALEIVQRGRLIVNVNVSSATISIDGVALGRDRWSGDLRVGLHRVDVVARGFPPYSAMVAVPANEARALAVDMNATPGVSVSGQPAVGGTASVAPADGSTSTAVPSPYDARVAPVPREYNWYLAGGLGLQGQTLRFSKALEGSTDAPDATKSHFVGGGILIAKLGRKVTSYLDAEILGEVGGFAAASYKSPDLPSTMAKVSLTSWVLAPALRLHTRGNVRGLVGVAAGLEGQSLSAVLGTLDSAGGTTTKKVGGSATAGMLLIELGGQLQLGRVLLEATVFGDIHGVGGVEDAGRRVFLDSPAVRGGGKLLVGYAF